jgi:hypothetical protein
LLIFRVPIGVPVGSAISTSWVSRWVSTPTTASTSSPAWAPAWSFLQGAGQPSAPVWVEATEWHLCDGSRPQADRLLIRPTGGPGRCRQPRRTGQMKGTPKEPNP